MANVIMRQLPSGDIFNVRSDEDQKAVIDALPKLRSPRGGVAGANQCSICGAAFTSFAARDAHIKAEHMNLPAKLDTVELPDGTRVPAELLVQEFMKSKQREAELLAAAEAEALQDK